MHGFFFIKNKSGFVVGGFFRIDPIAVCEIEKSLEIFEFPFFAELFHVFKNRSEISSAAPVDTKVLQKANSVAGEEVSSDISRIRDERKDLLCQVTAQKSFEQACKIVKEYILQVYDALTELNTSSGERQARMALDYIQKNYMDPNLSLNDICSYLNISTSYFSTIFKEVTGETFTEVLIRTRMEKAKELLENTTMKNYEIAERVGFADAHYFGISFKKMTGCTPTEYAREKRK